MSTNEVISTGRRRRRRHSELFKAEAIGACQQAGGSIAAVALARGLNPNMLRHWVRLAERKAPIAIRPTVPEVAVENAHPFVPVALSSSNSTEGPIRVNAGLIVCAIVVRHPHLYLDEFGMPAPVPLFSQTIQSRTVRRTAHRFHGRSEWVASLYTQPVCLHASSISLRRFVDSRCFCKERLLSPQGFI
jgi:transposase